MAVYRYKHVFINIHGEIDESTLREDTIRFMQNVNKCRKSKLRERKKDDYHNTSRVS